MIGVAAMTENRVPTAPQPHNHDPSLCPECSRIASAQPAPPLDVEAALAVVQAWSDYRDDPRSLTPVGVAIERLAARLEAEAAQPAPPLDVVGIIESFRYSEPLVANTEPHRMWQRNEETLDAILAHLGSAAAQRAPCHAWCQLPKDHPGLCEGDQ